MFVIMKSSVIPRLFFAREGGGHSVMPGKKKAETPDLFFYTSNRIDGNTIHGCLRYSCLHSHENMYLIICSAQGLRSFAFEWLGCIPMASDRKQEDTTHTLFHTCMDWVLCSMTDGRLWSFMRELSCHRFSFSFSFRNKRRKSIITKALTD